MRKRNLLSPCVSLNMPSMCHTARHF